MNFDDLIQHQNERFFGKKRTNNHIEIYPYFEIDFTSFNNKINTGNLQIIAVILIYKNSQSLEKEFYLQFFKKEYEKYYNEIIQKFVKDILKN